MLTATTMVNSAVAGAKDLPDLVKRLDAVDPSAAQAITGKALIASRTPWGVLATMLVTWASAKYGLGWDADTCTLVAGAGAFIGSYAMRYVTTGPIRTLVTTPTTVT